MTTTTNTSTDAKRLTMKDLAARIDAQDAAMATLTASLAELTKAITAIAQGNAQAPAPAKKAGKTASKAKKPANKAAKKPAPTREEWLAYRDAHKGEAKYAGMTRHERNSAMYKELLASRKKG